MAVRRIGDALKRAAEFESAIEKLYADIRDGTGDDGVRLLTYYLARHRGHMKRVLGDFRVHEIDSICDEALDCNLSFPKRSRVLPERIEPRNVRARELLEWAVSNDEALIGLYGRILEQPLSERATDLFHGLMLLEENDVVMLKKMIAMNYF